MLQERSCGTIKVATRDDPAALRAAAAWQAAIVSLCRSAAMDAVCAEQLTVAASAIMSIDNSASALLCHVLMLPMTLITGLPARRAL